MLRCRIFAKGWTFQTLIDDKMSVTARRAFTCALAKIMRFWRREPLGHGKRGKPVFFPQFLVGMFATSAVVAIWSYRATGSFWMALAWTFLALIILQIGYLLLAFGLFYLRPTKRLEEKPEPPQPIRRDGGVSSPGGRQ